MKNPNLKALHDDFRQHRMADGELLDTLKIMGEMLMSFRHVDYDIQVVPVVRDRDIEFDEKKVRSLFELAGFRIKNVYRLENQYWPDAYIELRLKNPYWLVQTEHGMIEVGPRKSVYVIDWRATDVRAIVTEDQVTKESYMVHAWNYPKLVEYMTQLKKLSVEAENGR